MEQFIVSARKYRPITFATVVGQSSIAQTLKNAIARKQLAHAYLFCGPRGVGKTTCARIFAKTINCMNLTPDGEACGECESCKAFAEGRSYNIHELDAASNNSVEDIRSLTEQVRVPPQIGKYSVYIIDEVHMLSQAAFNAFLKTLEEPPAHAIFILATTEKHKIIPTILSRCQVYDFNRIKVDDAVKYLSDIAQKEGIKCEPQALHVIAQKADGAMRDALSIFDQVVAFSGKDVTYAKVIENLNILDYDYYFKLVDAFLIGDYCTALNLFDEILSKGFEAQHFIRGLCSHFRDLLVCKDTKTSALLEVGASIAQTYKQQAERCTVNFLFSALSIANTCDIGYKTSSNQRLHIELTLCKLSSITTDRRVAPTIVVEEKKPVQTQTSQPDKQKQQNETPQPEAQQENLKPKTEEKSIAEQKEQARQEKQDTELLSRPKDNFSIKGLGKISAEAIKNDDDANIKKTLAHTSFTDEQLQTAWANYINDIDQHQPRLASAMRLSKPVCNDGCTVIFKVQHEALKQAIDTRGMGTKICEYLKQKLNNADIKLDVQVNETEIVKDNTPLLYTDTEKLKYMREKNPDLTEFQKLTDTL